jgi:hypothetical protein
VPSRWNREACADASGVASAQVRDGERRHLTLLFCDLVNSTEIAAHLDPEDWRDIAARDLLTPLYGGFTEGFDTADLKDAKALLDELGN